MNPLYQRTYSIGEVKKAGKMWIEIQIVLPEPKTVKDKRKKQSAGLATSLAGDEPGAETGSSDSPVSEPPACFGDN